MLSRRGQRGSGEVLLRGKRSLAVSAVRMPSAMVVVGNAALTGSVLGSFESSGGADLIVGSDADYEGRS